MTENEPYRTVRHARQVQPHNGDLLNDCRDVEVRPAEELRRTWPRAARQESPFGGDTLCRDREGLLYLVSREHLAGDSSAQGALR